MINQVLLFLNIGGGELLFIVLFIVMFFGSKKIPELARGIGKGLRELQNATNDIQKEIKDSTKDITQLKNSVNIEKQVKDMIFNNQSDDKFISNQEHSEINQVSEPIKSVLHKKPDTSSNENNSEQNI